MSEESLAAAIKRVGSAVELLRDSKAPAFAFPAKSEWTNWRSEQEAWREGCALLDQSHHMTSLYLRGPGAIDLLKHVGTNTFQNFGVNKAKQLIMASHEGYLIGDVVLFHLEDELFSLVGNHLKLKWVQYQLELGGYAATAEIEKNTHDRTAGAPRYYRYELQGPSAVEVVEKAAGQAVGGVRFFNMADLTIAGHCVRSLRHGMAGRPGFELFGPWKEGPAVLDALLKAGEGAGLVRAGAKAYSTANLESGYMPGPIPAIFSDNPDVQRFREWLPAGIISGLGGSFTAPDIDAYLVTPYELGYGRMAVFNHDFIGCEALQKLASEPQRRKVTLVWDAGDVADAVASMLRPGLGAKYIEFPKTRYARYQYDTVLAGGQFAGLSMDCGYITNERALVSLAVLDEAYAEPGTEVTFLWGENPVTAKPAVENHIQREMRATVAPAPIGDFARQNYRAS
jgi:glycine cleavage system aminomethyltransferase T